MTILLCCLFSKIYNNMRYTICYVILCIIATEISAMVHFAAPVVNDITGHAGAEIAPFTGIPVVFSYGLGDDAVSTHVAGWNLGDFTGLISDRPANQQRGKDDSYGGYSVQMVGDAAGGHINTYSSDIRYLWPSKSSRLEISALVQVPSLFLDRKDMAAYLQFSFNMHSTRSPGLLWYMITLFDNRGTFFEHIGWDDSTSTPYVETYAAQGTRLQFAETLVGSSTFQPWTGWRNFTVSIPYDVFAGALMKVKTKYNDKIETDPSYWVPNLVAINGEMYWPVGSNGRMGWSCKGLKFETKP